MKTSSLIIFAFSFFVISACTGQDYDNYNDGYDNYDSHESYDQPNNNQAYTQQGAAPRNQQVAQRSGNLEMKPIMNPKTNRPSSYIPLPTSWKMNNAARAGAPAITGPNGLEIYASKYQSFVFSNDPMTRQAYQASGVQMRPPAGIQNVVQQDLAGMAQQNGLTFSGQYPLQQVAQKDMSYLMQLNSSAGNCTVDAVGTEWSDKNGKKVLIVVHYTVMPSSGMVMWGYYFQTLTADKGYFETAKKTYIDGLINTQFNQQDIAAYKQNEAARANSSWSAHNARMRANQANFEARQRIHNDTYNSINQSSMDAYNARSESMDRTQHALTNAIREESTVTDPANGQSYQVEGNYNHYWMNGQGEYIGTDNSLANPNLDPNLNNQNWEQAPQNPYGK